MPVSLTAIRQMIKNRQYDDARSALAAFLRENPKSAEGWYLLSLAAETTPKRLDAARRAAKLAPKNARVQSRIDELMASPKTRSGRGRVVLLIVALLALVIVGIAFIPRIIQTQNQAQATAATAAALQPTSATDSASDAAETVEPTAEAVVSTEEIIATPNISATPPPSQTATHTPTVETSPTAQPTTPSPSATVQPATTVAPTLPPPTAPPLTIVPSPAPVVVPPGVVLNEAQEVGVGQMWVVAATRNAESLIRELGGFITPASPGYEWVLVELFMICSGTANCGPQPSSLQIVGPSGIPYGIPTGFEVQPNFGPSAYVEGQVWGYAGFIVPTSEPTLSLLYTQSGQSFAFDLQ